MGVSIKEKIRAARQLAALSDNDRSEILALVDEFNSDAADTDQQEEKPATKKRGKPGPKPGSKRKKQQPVIEAVAAETVPQAVSEDDAVDAAIKGIED